MMVSLDLIGKKVLFIGGGKIAAKKAKKFSEAGAIISVIARDVIDTFYKYSDDIRIADYNDGDEDGYFIIVCATQNAELNARITDRCESQNILCLNVSGKSDMSLTSIRRVDDIEISVSTYGKNPSFSKWLADKFLESIDKTMVDKFLAHTKLRRIVIKKGLDKKILKDALDMSASEIEEVIKNIDE